MSASTKGSRSLIRRVADGDVQFAKVLHDLGHHLLHGLLVGHIRLDLDGPRSAVTNRLQNLVSFVGDAIGN